MENLDNVFGIIEENSSKSKTKNKRRWREIEALKDKYRLKRELQDIDGTMDYSLEDLL